MVEVAAAILERADGAFLLGQRPAGKVYAGWWEFPGGKVDEGESARAALVRELHEELAIDVTRAYPWITRVHAYEHATVRLHFFRVAAWRGEPHPKEHRAIRWQRLDEPIAEPMLPANAPVLRSLALPLEYAITDAQTYGVARMLERLDARLLQGLRLIQVRDKELADRPALIREIVARAREHGARVLVNGGPDVADGLHFTAAQLMALKVRPDAALVGASCHNRKELERAMELQLDFVVLGPVKATASHAGTPLLGWERFVQIARGASIPVYAIGGLQSADLDAARNAGAHGVAMIRGSWL
jgi:8-oxo-dGTP diphosphatase